MFGIEVRWDFLLFFKAVFFPLKKTAKNPTHLDPWKKTAHLRRFENPGNAAMPKKKKGGSSKKVEREPARVDDLFASVNFEDRVGIPPPPPLRRRRRRHHRRRRRRRRHHRRRRRASPPALAHHLPVRVG